MASNDHHNDRERAYRAWKEINLENLDHNLAELKSALPDDCHMMAVVKADAYGHGNVQIARHLQQVGVGFFAVAEIEEGIDLRKNGVKGHILVLGETCENRFHELVQYKLQQTVVDADYAKLLNDYGHKIDVHVKIDTGMNRLGESYVNHERILSIYRQTNLCIIGTYSHLSASDRLETEDIAYTKLQISRFQRVIKNLKSAGIDPGILHIQGSYGILNYPDLKYGLARPGIALYGVLSTRSEVKKINLHLRPVLSLKSRIELVKNVKQNQRVGYGLDCFMPQDRKIATVSVGYADGIPRELSNRGYVLVRGQKAKIIGRICMDHLMIDVTHIANVQRGDTATIIGQDGEAIITAEQFAEQCGTITNEILSRIGSRVMSITRV